MCPIDPRALCSFMPTKSIPAVLTRVQTPRSFSIDLVLDVDGKLTIVGEPWPVSFAFYSR